MYLHLAMDATENTEYTECMLNLCNARVTEKNLCLTRHKSITLAQALAGLAL